MASEPQNAAPTERASLTNAKGDGETWEEYAHRLEARVKEQRDQLRSLQALRGSPANRRARQKITSLELALGRKAFALDKQDAGLRALAQERAHLLQRITVLERVVRNLHDTLGCYGGAGGYPGALKGAVLTDATYRFEAEFFFGPCTVEEANAFADTLLGMREGQALGIGAIGMHAVDDNDEPIQWPDTEGFS